MAGSGPTYRTLMNGYWKSPFGKSFRKAGYQWGYFGESVRGYVQNFYRRRYRIEYLDPVPPHVHRAAEVLERFIRERQAQKGVETRRRNLAIKKAEELREVRRRGRPQFEGFQQDGHH